MLDQSFSSENFKKLIIIENRRGSYLVGEFFPEIAEIDFQIQEVTKDRNVLRTRKLFEIDKIEQKEVLNAELEKLVIRREDLLDEKLLEITKRIDHPDFRIGISIDNTILTKPVFKVERKIENILTLKQLQYNFRKLYKVKQSNRYSVVNHIKNILDDGFPKIILKTDLKDFYESIPHDQLLQKLNDENLLTQSSRRLISQILKEYKTIAHSNKGVPRGVGISAYLVELYMRGVDSKISEMPNVVYYGRYVDDIIIVYLPSQSYSAVKYIDTIKDIFLADGLTMNEESGKTKIVDLTDRKINVNYEFDYLGYKFRSGYVTGKHVDLTVLLSSKKIDRYKDRINKAISIYESLRGRNEKNARRVLVKRLRFMTSNFRLMNNKKYILSGVYYSNSLLSEVTDLRNLDVHLAARLSSLPLPVLVISRLINKYSFVAGFNPTKILKFSVSDFSIIKKGWL